MVGCRHLRLIPASGQIARLRRSESSSLSKLNFVASRLALEQSDPESDKKKRGGGLMAAHVRSFRTQTRGLPDVRKDLTWSRAGGLGSDPSDGLPLSVPRCPLLGMEPPPIDQDDALTQPRGRDVRRALLAVLLRAGGPLTISEIADHLQHDEHIDVDWLASRTHWLRPAPTSRQPSVSKRLSDMLRHQVAAGRAVRISPGVYAANRQGLSLSTIYRCLNWRRIEAGEIRGS